MKKFSLKINDREYVETVNMNKDYSYDLFKNNIKSFIVEINGENVSFKDSNDEVFRGGIIYQSYDEWVDETDNLITLHDLDNEDLSEDEKQFIYFIEATIQLFYSISADAIWPDKWWKDLDLSKLIHECNEKEEIKNEESLSTIDKLKNLFHIN